MELVSILNFDKNEIVVLGKNPDSVQKNFFNTLYLHERHWRKKANKKLQEAESGAVVEKDVAESKKL